MRNKHLQISSDGELLKRIYQKVEEELTINRSEVLIKLWIKFMFYFSISAWLYFQLYSNLSENQFICTFVGYGFMSLLFAFNFSHDFSHNTVFKSKKWNNLGYTSIYTLVGAHAEAWKERHVHSHHFAPNVEKYDSDLKISKLIRVIPDSDYHWFHKFQPYYALIAYTSYSLFWVFIKDFVLLYSGDEFTSKKGFAYHVSFWIQKSIYISFILVLPLVFSGQTWQTVLIGFICMHLSQSLFLLLTFFMTHHVESTHYPSTDENGFIQTSWMMNQIRSSNDMHPFSKVANFILGGFNNHIAHHLFPHIHHIHYPELSKIIYKTLNEEGISPNQTTYWGGIWSHLKLLKRMSSR